MEKKPRLLMQLCDSLEGPAGIVQETQLLFSSFLDSSILDTTGLIIKRGAYDFHKLIKSASNTFIKSEPHQRVKRYSDFVIRYMATIKKKPSALDKLKLSWHIFLFNCLTTLGCSVPVYDFDAAGFEHFIWESFFAHVLDAAEFKKMVNASFHTVSYSTTFMQFAGLFALFYPKLNTKNYDIFLAQNPFPARVAKGTQMVIRYHDAIPLLAPHLTPFAKYHQLFHYRALALNAKKAWFVCTSEAVRRDLLGVFPRLEKRSVVIHDMVSEHYFVEEKSHHSLANIIYNRSSSTQIISLLNETIFPYLLMVSTLDIRKNHLRLIKAWERVRLKQPIKLIIVGKLGHGSEAILEAMKAWEARGELFHLQDVALSELRFLYKEATCVVCPSLMEGFDLSGIEAMRCGGRVVASDIAVHREIYGEAAIYFDPYSIEEQVNAIESIALPEHAAFAENIRQSGLKWAPRYSQAAITPQWEDFFSQRRLKYKKGRM
jgi:glycosyltransferase involved in cell wall biosynthesis